MLRIFFINIKDLQNKNYRVNNSSLQSFNLRINNLSKRVYQMTEDDPFSIFEELPKRQLLSFGENTNTLKKKVQLNENIPQKNLKSQAPENLVDEEPTTKNHMEILQEQLQVGKDQDSDNQMTIEKIKPENIQIIMERSEEGCIHEIFYPKDYVRKFYYGTYEAKQYKFKLDPFQKKSIHAIQCDQSVLVCAHTSAGKTVVAQYAIAHSLQNKSRVIYTSPIKALSNQKYRQLKDEFIDVGLITGDVTIDQNATCLVMTTEILRNMIYRGSEIVREVKWVIFDEVHYMRDKERGVVWEQTIIMLPSNVKYVFLSATIGNPSQFATWITKLRKQPCNVVYTDFRPVPLQQYLCPANGEGLYMVVDEKGKFHQQNFNKAMQVMGQSINVIGIDSKRNKKKMNQGSDLFKIIKVIMQQNLDPVLIFSFSKKDVQSYAKSVCTKYDLTTKQEKQRIDQVYENAIGVLSQEDKNLPQLKVMKQIVKKGIGIHHGGLLPLLKEVIELLFQDGLIKVLFSTETFSMGLNMPAKTVVFTSVKKWDGEKLRWITGGQYIQMSGRAGRRGLDKKGLTILMLDEKMQPQMANSILKGKSDDLLSSFYINYNMLLNSQRLQDIDSDYILSRSLLQFQHQAKLPQIIADHRQKLQAYKALKFENEEELEQLFLLQQRAKQHQRKIKDFSRIPKNILPYMNIGRIVHMKEGNIDWGLGISVNFHKKDARKNKEQTEAIYLFDVMVYCKLRDPATGSPPRPAKLDEQGELCVMTFSINCIDNITIWKISKLPPQLTSQASKKQIHKVLVAFTAKKPEYISLVSNNIECINQKKLLDTVEQQIINLKYLEPQLENYQKKRLLYDEVKKSASLLKSMSGIVLRKQKKAYNRVMKRTGLIQKGVVSLKGNVACQISSNNHQILLTHLLFSGYFSEMTAIEIASILTSLVHEQKSSTERKVTKNPRLRFKLEELLNHAKSIFRILKECKVSVEEDQYIDSIKQQLIEVCYEWCNGASFATLCKMTDTYQGSIIRTLRRLNELLKQMASASNIIGNQQLSNKFLQASQKVFRGIVQAASLYTL